ncbi:MAG: transketolase [Nanoarchaeota archaeon]|nr:transketolase [Nanoarchaeota archaeon]MBU1029599.1 transketolase [Nanoarchaeota archaeon]MBU1850210.1 transketolase [Nanoarchaeota archaeon]
MDKIKSVFGLKEKAKLIRQDIIRMIYQAGSGHPGGSLGLADIFSVLYFNVLNHNPKKPFWPERDRLILSNGHVCPVRYSAMARTGYFSLKELLTLRKLGSRLQGHPSFLDLPGVESSSGSLGQGLGVAVGMALAAKIDSKKNFVYCVISDGELNEGSSWEAFMLGAKYALDNLIVIIDRNHIQISGCTEDICPIEDLGNKIRTFNWQVFEVDGHNIKSLLSTFKKAKSLIGKPKVIIATTVLGKGVSFMENKYLWHGKAPSEEEARKALEELNLKN